MVVFEPVTLVRVLPLESNADPTVVSPLEFSHPLHAFPLSGAVALKQCNIFSLELQTRVFGYTPAAAKGKNTHGSLGAENVPSLAAVSITPILRAERWTCEVLSSGGVLRGARRTLRTAHPITRSLSDAAWACTWPSLPALRSTEAAFCRLRGPRSFYSDSSSASTSRVSSSTIFSCSLAWPVSSFVTVDALRSSVAPGCVAAWICCSLRIATCV